LHLLEPDWSGYHLVSAGVVVDIVVIVAPVVAVVVVSVALVFIIEVVVVTVAPVVIVDVVVVAGSLEQSLNAFQDILALQHVSTDSNPVSHGLIFPPHDGSPSQSRTHMPLFQSTYQTGEVGDFVSRLEGLVVGPAVVGLPVGDLEGEDVGFGGVGDPDGASEGGVVGPSVGD